MENHMEVFSVFQWTSSILHTKKLRPLIQHRLLLQDCHKRGGVGVGKLEMSYKYFQIWE